MYAKGHITQTVPIIQAGRLSRRTDRNMRRVPTISVLPLEWQTFLYRKHNGG